MQNFRQQNGPTVTATPHVKPVTHGDSGTRSQSLLLPHSAVQRPLVPPGYSLFGGSSLPSGTRRHVRETQSSDGDATTTSPACGTAVPRSQMRPTGSPPQAAANSPMASATTTRVEIIAGAIFLRERIQVKRTTRNKGEEVGPMA